MSSGEKPPPASKLPPVCTKCKRHRMSKHLEIVNPRENIPMWLCVNCGHKVPFRLIDDGLEFLVRFFHGETS